MIKMVRPANLDDTRWIPDLSRSLTILLKPETYCVFVTHFEDIIEGGKGSANVQGRAKTSWRFSKIVSKYDQEITAFYWYQIFALDSAVVEIQEMFSSHGGNLTNAMHHHGEIL